MTNRRPNAQARITAKVVGQSETPQSTLTVHVPLKFTIRGGRKTIIGEVPKRSHTPPRTRFDDAITKAFARGYRWKQKLENGTYATADEIAKTEQINKSYVKRILRMNLLAPKIVEAALNGSGPQR